MDLCCIYCSSTARAALERPSSGTQAPLERHSSAARGPFERRSSGAWVSLRQTYMYPPHVTSHFLIGWDTCKSVCVRHCSRFGKFQLWLPEEYIQCWRVPSAVYQLSMDSRWNLSKCQKWFWYTRIPSTSKMTSTMFHSWTHIYMYTYTHKYICTYIYVYL